MNDCKWKKSKNIKYLEKKYGKTLQISRRIYKIIFVTEITRGNDSYSGFMDPGEMAIYIDEKSDIVSTLMHELIHAELHEGGFHQQNNWNMDIEEIICQIVAEGLSVNFGLKRK